MRSKNKYAPHAMTSQAVPSDTRSMIDLRSDTVTRPTPAMREAMARAEVGDDVFGDDPTVHALEDEIARITGKEAALFVSSGTMGNQLAIATQARPGDDVITGQWAHLVCHEAAAGAALSGVQFSVAGTDGMYTPEELEAAVQPRVDWAPRTALVAVENTHNRAGGRVWPESLARAVALCAPFDTVSTCFSKGLGAPVGSAFCGPRALVQQGRRLRKRWGGGMRQSGILAAAALHALAHHRARLAEDHANARILVESLDGVEGARVEPERVETNLVYIEVDAVADAVARAARERGLLISAAGPRLLRAVTHLDVSRAAVLTAVAILKEALLHARTP
jgi:threonine aldolase